MQFTLFDPLSFKVSLEVKELTLTKKEDTLSECCLTFKISSQLYQRIDTKSLFNLKPELRGSLNAVAFQSEADIEIEVTLQPQLLSELAEHATDSEDAIAYLIAYSQEILSTPLENFNEESESDTADESTQIPSCNNPLLLTESWFALHVKQNLESGKIGYRTFWSYVNPAVLTPEAITSGQFSEAMEQFLKDRNEADLSIVGKAILDAFEEMANGFKDWDETEFLKQTEAAISEFFAEVTKTFENLADPSLTSSASSSASTGRIYQAMINFFSEDDWAFAKLQGELTLRLVFKGKNGQWNCYAKAINDRQQFIFYSIAPVQVPEVQHLTIAELLIRANYGLTIGSFEFNFDTGEIFYKTSLDVTGDRLTPALIKQLVYTNVLTMDQYLPGIQAVLAGTIPAEAIAAIEQSSPNAPISSL